MEIVDDTSSRESFDGEPPSKRRRTSNLATHPAREVGLMRNLPGDKFSSFVGSASGIYFIRSVYGAIRHSNSASGTQNQTPGSDIVPGEDDHLPPASPDTSKRLWKDHEVTTRHNSRVSFQELVAWSGSYFANWHPAYPFLHAPAILEYFKKISRDEVPSSSSDLSFEMIILRSVMSISLADRRQDQPSAGDPVPLNLVFPSYDTAVDSLQRVVSQPASIQSLQAAISVQLFLVSMLRLNAASRLGGLVIRMALQLGLHRCPNRFPTFSPSDRELRQRLFWSLYCIDRSICQSMGLPLSLRDDDIDVCHPSEERHLTQQFPSDHRLRLVEFLAQHSEIRGEIMELRNKSILHSRKETDQAVVITAKLARWWNDVEEFIDSDENDPPTLSTYHRTVLTILYHESIISLNRPLLATSNKGSAYNAALQYCIGSSRSTITTLHKAIKPRTKNDQSQTPLSLPWPSFTWVVWMSTYVLFYATNSKHVSETMASRLAERSLEILQHLSRRGSVWPEACAAAIRDLRMQLLQNPPSSRHRITSQQKLGYPTVHDNQTQHSRSPSTPGPALDRTSSNKNATTSTLMLDHLSRPTAAHQELSLTRNSGLASGSTASPTVHTGLGDPWTSDLAHSSQPSRGQTVHHETPVECTGPSNFPGMSNSNFGHLQWDDYMQADNRLSQNIALPSADSTDPFAGFDIPFWMGQDQYSDMISQWS